MANPSQHTNPQQPDGTSLVRPTEGDSMAAHEAPTWYKDAVFYELYVRAFKDGNGDGHGDLQGLLSKLDYLQELGIDCIWLLPVYPSPLVDDGYDVADYRGVHEDYGTLEDFKAVIEGAHERGMHIIVDIVLNHTSDQHPWFTASRTSTDSPMRNWYVWSRTDQLYQNARVIFLDTESSNWTYDSHTSEYYWHRFFSAQPDLNYDSPAVQQEMLDIIDFWMELGLDGFRVDAVPYLFEREGTNCENLAETHSTSSACALTSTRSGRAACCWPRRTNGPKTCAPTLATTTSSRWRSTSRSCRACSWR